MKLYAIFSAHAIKMMKGNRGKLAAQAGHAVLHSWWDAAERFPDMASAYKDRVHGAAKKITLIADDAATLEELERVYKEVCGVSLVVDAGLTVFKEPTTTCLGLGPILPRQVGIDLQRLDVLI